MQVQKTVFISYRRTNVYHARAVYQALMAKDYDAFLDYASIDSGSFERIILNQIAARAHFIVILTPTALERCTKPGDWLRREIEHALDLKRNIIPLMFDMFDWTMADKYLTGKLALLKAYNGLSVPVDYFDEAMGRLMTRYLNKPLATVLHPTPPEDIAAVEERKAAANDAIAASDDEFRLLEALEQSFETDTSEDLVEIEWHKDVVDLSDEELSAEQYLAQGDDVYQRHEFHQAIEYYTEAIRLKPSTRAYRKRANARMALGDLQGALNDYRKGMNAF